MADRLSFYDDEIRKHLELEMMLWRTARNVLEARPGWHFEVDDRGRPAWCFGEAGACRLVVTVSYDTFLLYDADNGIEHNPGPNAEMLEWGVAKYEPDHKGLTPLQEDSQHQAAAEAIAGLLGETGA